MYILHTNFRLYCSYIHQNLPTFQNINPRLNRLQRHHHFQETQANGHTGQTSNDATHQYIALQKKKQAKKHMEIWKGN